MGLSFDNSYSKLPHNFYSKIPPSAFPNPQLVLFNNNLAADIGISNLTEQQVAEYFSGNKVFDGSEPIALIYAGHQYGHFVPQLGDGRAVLLGEIIDKNNQRFDLQLKGSGQTPYSRRGDGKAALGPMIREYIVSNTMFNFGIKTCVSLAVVKTGETIYREAPIDGAVITRVARSHIRVGTFEYFAAKNDSESLKILFDYTINRHFSDLKNNSNIYQDFILEAAKLQAELIADWMRIGFIHGVMNTDNMLVCGDAIDFGPCAFLDEYDSDKTFSSIDRHGRYSFSNQPNIALWNIFNLYGSLTLLMPEHNEEEMVEEIKNFFIKHYAESYWQKMFAKIGIKNHQPEDKEMLQSLLNIMQKDSLDFTNTFRYLSLVLVNEADHLNQFVKKSGNLLEWIKNWKKRLETQNKDFKVISNEMKMQNPAVIPRNHLIERAIVKAYEQQDFSYAKLLIEVLEKPFDDVKDLEFISPPKPDEVVTKTFCGT